MNEKSTQPNGTPDTLEALLRQNQSDLPDDGFAARVITNLPPRRNLAARRSLILLAGLLAASAVLLCNAPAAFAVLLDFRHLARAGDPLALLRIAPVIAALGSLLWAWLLLPCEET